MKASCECLPRMQGDVPHADDCPFTVHIRKYGRGNGKLTECGAPATRNDVRSSAWLKSFPKCPACSETIRLRMARVAAIQASTDRGIAAVYEI
jgi:hypothetical protein